MDHFHIKDQFGSASGSVLTLADPRSSKESTMAEDVKVVVFKDGSHFIAQCLEVDIAAQGNSEDEALNRLRIAFRAEVAEAAETGKSVYDIGPAPEAMRRAYEAEAGSRRKLVA